MRKFFVQLCTLSSLFLFASCASRYQIINPQSLDYGTGSEDNNVRVEYRSNVLTGNYAKSEQKSGVSLIAVKITNNSSKSIIPAQNIKVFSGEKEMEVLNANTFYNITQQNADKSLLFLLLAPINVYTYSSTTNGGQVTSEKRRFYPVGLVLGPALAFGNRGAANKANKNYKKELLENNIWEKLIVPGQTGYGLIGLKDASTLTLTFKTN